jgi:hypothetical protein
MRFNVFKQSLETDYNAMKEAVLPATLKEIGAMKQRYIEKYLVAHISRKFAQFNEKKMWQEVFYLN